MTRTREQINPVPYEVELVREGDKVVEVTIRAVADAELTSIHIRNAMQAVLERVPRPGERAGRRNEGRRNLISDQIQTIEELGLPKHEMALLLATHAASEGRITDEYLARLSLAYGMAAKDHRDVSMRLAAALNRPLQTIKGHLMRARKEGFLSPAEEGREGGEATSKAKDVIVAAPRLPERYMRDFSRLVEASDE